MNLNLSYVKSVSGILKFVELVCVVVAFGILRGANVGNFDVDAFYFGVGVMVSCMIVTPLLMVCYLMGKMEIQQTILEIALNFVFFFFLAIYGIMGVVEYSGWSDSADKDAGLAMSVFALFAAAAYLADTVMSVINYNK